ncbi:nickel import ATP-binding protein NikE [Bradyrhizobium sp. LHD-71]|uniref:nickel import ATP-binding protein NikE n=1 Tax=Bradyrhizobium sp. LHD-71 TaxID=3072141 RepID=UPI00280C5933|nr:nickel import ATP-binding protein NikE [Bradyrhizobium sp. LHD-71]MDQ8726973.1 nickel import ATP-binding protein NikE [Bradyrhizobium sp. LHD-71]
MSLLSTTNVSRVYRSFSLTGTKTHVALQNVSLQIAEGETVALVGQSGCGKSTLARLLAGLEHPNEGDVLFEGRSLRAFSRADWFAYRRVVQMVFQDPISAVNPRHSIEAIIAEPLRHLTALGEKERSAKVAELLASVGLRPQDTTKRPAQMSGGQLQRVCIARALAPEPKLIVLDEAVSNLDLLLQMQMLDLLRELQTRARVSFLFITHDLRLVERFCSRVIVLDEGRIVEQRAVKQGFEFEHPAARRLKAAILPAFPKPRPVAEDTNLVKVG